MTKEKQIEEIARVLCGMASSCDKCMFSKVKCYEHQEADAIYKAGYRKQSEGEWVDSNGQPVGFDKMNKGCPEKSCYCSVCGEWLTASNEYPCYGYYCPKCGARMKGGAE